MRPRRPAVATLLMLAGLTGCVDPFLGPEPRDDPVEVFETLWQEFDAYYSYFIYKGIDWDSVYDRYRPRVTAATRPQELADIMGEMVVGLEDGHADLYTAVGTYAYTGWYDRFAENYDPAAVRNYVTTGRPSQGGAPGLVSAPGLRYGWLTDRVAYIELRSFGDSGVRQGIDVALAGLAGAEALVIDVRHNGGGSDVNSDAVAGRLVTRRLRYVRVAYRNGPEHDDFTGPIDGFIEPAGAERFPGPLAVLTNRRSFSTAETFVLAVRAMAGDRPALVIGDTTGGGFGNPIWRELPNGWTFRVPRWMMWDLEGNNYEGVGVPPDVPVQISDSAAAALGDPIIETAIAELEARLP